MTRFAHELNVGDPIEPRRFNVSSVVNQQCLFAQEDYHPRYLQNAGRKREILHPALVIQMLANTKSPSYRVPEHIGAIVAEAQTEFLRPLHVGEDYESAWKVVRRYTKRAKDYQEIRAEIMAGDGTPMIKRTLQIAYVDHSQSAPSDPSPREENTQSHSMPASRGNTFKRTPEDGFEKSGHSKQVSLARMLAFSGGEIGTANWPASNLHTDALKARSAGLKDLIASGIQAEGYLIALILDEVGEQWFRSGTLSVKHLGMLSPGDRVIPKIKVYPSDGTIEGPRYRFDVRCERLDAQLTVVGEAAVSQR